MLANNNTQNQPNNNNKQNSKSNNNQKLGVVAGLAATAGSVLAGGTDGLKAQDVNPKTDTTYSMSYPPKLPSALELLQEMMKQEADKNSKLDTQSQNTTNKQKLAKHEVDFTQSNDIVTIAGRRYYVYDCQVSFPNDVYGVYIHNSQGVKNIIFDDDNKVINFSSIRNDTYICTYDKNGKILDVYSIDHRQNKDSEHKGIIRRHTNITDKNVQYLNSTNEKKFNVNFNSAGVGESELGKHIKDLYNKDTVNLNSSSDTPSIVGNHIKLTRDKDFKVTKISIRSNDINEDLIRKSDDTFVTSNGEEVYKVRLRRNGQLEFGIDRDGDKTIYCVSPEGNLTTKNGNISLLDTKISSLTYTEFGSRQSKSEITRYGSVSQQNQINDIRQIIKDAMENGQVPVFLLSYHGHINYNRGVGSDSEYIKLIANICEEMNYEGPVGMTMLHCFSGVTQAEIDAMGLFKAGAYLIKSQDARLSYFNPNAAHTAEQTGEETALESAAHYGADMLAAYMNNPTAVVVTENGTELYAENNAYSRHCTDRRKLAEHFDVNEIKEHVKDERMFNYWLNNSHSLFIMQLINYANDVYQKSDAGNTNSNTQTKYEVINNFFASLIEYIKATDLDARGIEHRYRDEFKMKNDPYYDSLERNEGLMANKNKTTEKLES